MSKMENWQLLPECTKETEGLDIVLACDGAALVGQVGHEIAVKLTREVEGGRMCCSPVYLLFSFYPGWTEGIYLTFSNFPYII